MSWYPILAQREIET